MKILKRDCERVLKLRRMVEWNEYQNTLYEREGKGIAEKYSNLFVKVEVNSTDHDLALPSGNYFALAGTIPAGAVIEASSRGLEYKGVEIYRNELCLDKSLEVAFWLLITGKNE